MLDQRAGRGDDHARDGAAAQRFLAKARGHRVAGRLDKARESLRRALGTTPDHPEVRYELGALAVAAGEPGQAVPHLAAALKGAPDRPSYWLALATALLATERVAEARAILERFRAQGFGGGETEALLAAFVARTCAAAQGRYDHGDLRGAEALLDIAILLDETHAGATYLAGAVAAQTNRLDLAFDLISIAIYREPANPLFFSGLGNVLSLRGDHDGALSALEKAIAIDPDLAIAHSNLAGLHQRRFRFGAALRHAERAVALDPRMAAAHGNRGSILMGLGRVAEGIAAFDRAIALDGTALAPHSNRLFAKLYAAHVPPAEYAADAHAFGRRFADPLLRRRPFANDRSADRRLRVGFVSGDFCHHALIRFFEPFLRDLDRTGFEAVAYMTHAVEDTASERLRRLFDRWSNIAGLDDDAAADRIEGEGIDVLVDLSGHSAGNRLMLFARKPAPVQVTWIGHPGTTGLTAIDYRLTDPVTDPPGLADTLHTERLWRLPRVTTTYRGPDDLPPVRERAPFEDNGHITFGCFNRLTKVGAGTLAAWARILAAVPDARLFMVVGGVEAPEVRAEVEARLAEAGMPLERVDLHPRVNGAYFGLYHRVDVALDPYPYAGGTTSYDTLSMGVPFVTLRGGHAAARTGVCVLTAVGLAELIADDPDAYVVLARELARDPERLRGLRAGLRERLEASALMDHRGVAAEVGDALRGMWRGWLAQGA